MQRVAHFGRGRNEHGAAEDGVDGRDRRILRRPIVMNDWTSLARTKDLKHMTINYQIIFWRDIPAQVKVKAGRERSRQAALASVSTWPLMKRRCAPG